MLLDNYMDNSSGNLASHDSWSALQIPNSSGMGTLAHTTNTTSNTRSVLSTHKQWSFLFFCINNNDWPMDSLTNHVLSMFIASTQACGPLRGRPSPHRAQHRGPSRAAWHLSSCAVLRCPTLGWPLLCPCLLPPLCMIQAWARLAWEMPSLRAPSPGLRHPGRLWHRATEFQMKRLL